MLASAVLVHAGAVVVVALYLGSLCSAAPSYPMPVGVQPNWVTVGSRSGHAGEATWIAVRNARALCASSRSSRNAGWMVCPGRG